MELHVPCLPSFPVQFVFLILTACCASLFPYSLCVDEQYEYCKDRGSTCGNETYKYPVGVGKHGCGHPKFQISCGQNSIPVIEIDQWNYTILDFHQDDNSFVIVRGQNCQFLNDPFSNIPEFEDTAFRVRITYNLTLYVYKCKELLPVSGRCNSSVYYRLNQSMECPGKGAPVTVGVALTEWVSTDTKRDKSCESCNATGGTCGYGLPDSDAALPFVCYCKDGPSTHKCPAHGKKANIGVEIGASVGAAVFVAAALLVGITLFAKWRKHASQCCKTKVEKFLKEYADKMPTRYSYSQLKKITNNFAEKLGEGGFGVVYKGKLQNGTQVAVKLLDRHRQGESTEFMNEVATIGRVHHVNLVRLLGFCYEKCTSSLVYEFMVNGSLEKFIFAGKEAGKMLTWEQLYSIALGAARGIAYLHQDCENCIIHFDIKPHNILLDADFTPKVSDFGLAKHCGKGDVHISMTAARGTPGYVAPEICDSSLGAVTDKSDVYSFGMVLLEMAGGRKNIDWNRSHSSQFHFSEWAFKLLESGELGMRLRRELKEEDKEKAETLIKVGLCCIQNNCRDRPAMSRVVQMIEEKEGDVPSPFTPSNSSSTAPENPFSSSAEESSSIKTRF
eukprot:PITA_01034